MAKKTQETIKSVYIGFRETPAVRKKLMAKLAKIAKEKDERFGVSELLGPVIKAFIESD